MMVKHVKTPNKGGQNERHASAGVGMETCKSNIKWAHSEKTLLHLKDENSQMVYEQQE